METFRRGITNPLHQMYDSGINSRKSVLLATCLTVVCPNKGIAVWTFFSPQIRKKRKNQINKLKK